MKRPGQARPQSFRRQGLLILLPVVVLAVIGLFSLRQDKLLVWREASEQALAFANEFSDTLWAQLTTPDAAGKINTFTVDETGRMIDPPLASSLPVPAPFELGALSPEQTRLWETATRPLSIGATDTDAMAAAREFLDSKSPARLAAAVQYQLAIHQAVS